MYQRLALRTFAALIEGIALELESLIF